METPFLLYMLLISIYLPLWLKEVLLLDFIKISCCVCGRNQSTPLWYREGVRGVPAPYLLPIKYPI